eukprot:3577769-Pleurochrysis_carterae.AAC.1
MRFDCRPTWLRRRRRQLHASLTKSAFRQTHSSPTGRRSSARRSRASAPRPRNLPRDELAISVHRYRFGAARSLRGRVADARLRLRGQTNREGRGGGGEGSAVALCRGEGGMERVVQGRIRREGSVGA